MKTLYVLAFVLALAYAQPRNPKNVLKNQYLKRTARQALIAAATGQQPGAATGESCTALDCNNRGTCIGSKASPLCICVIGYTGARCEDTHCDSNRDCSGRGLCIGSSSNFSCLCHYGYGGSRCEYTTTAGQPAAPAGQQTNVVYGQQPSAGGQQAVYGPGVYQQQGYQQPAQGQVYQQQVYQQG